MDHNHVTSTDHEVLFAALIGDTYEWQTDLTPEQEVERIVESASQAGITMSDEARAALVELVSVERP